MRPYAYVFTHAREAACVALFIAVCIALVVTVNFSHDEKVRTAIVIGKKAESLVTEQEKFVSVIRTDKGNFPCTDSVVFERLQIGKSYDFRVEDEHQEWQVLFPEPTE